MKQAVAGNSEAQYQLALSYFTGRGGPVSISEGVRWLECAATAHHQFANEMLDSVKAAVFRAIDEKQSRQDKMPASGGD